MPALPVSISWTQLKKSLWLVGYVLHMNCQTPVLSGVTIASLASSCWSAVPSLADHEPHGARSLIGGAGTAGKRRKAGSWSTHLRAEVVEVHYEIIGGTLG